MKGKRFQFRINETLYERYVQALEKAGLTITEHLTSEVFRFVEAQEKKPTKKATHQA